MTWNPANGRGSRKLPYTIVPDKVFKIIPNNEKLPRTIPYTCNILCSWVGCKYNLIKKKINNTISKLTSKKVTDGKKVIKKVKNGKSFCETLLITRFVP